MKFIDTHTHLFSTQFAEDAEAVIERALAQEVGQFYLPNVDTKSIARMYELSDKYPNQCIPMIGLHPCSVKEDYKEQLAIIEKELEGERIFAGIGEMGLDYHWDLTFKKEQLDALRIQIEWAKKYELPVILHTRESFEDTYKVIAELNDERLTGVFHCFTGSVEEAQKVIDLGGFYMGIGGVVTFKNAGVDKTVAQLPLEYLVLETDAPYLAPTPHRGSRNESMHIPLIAQKVAEAKNLSLDEIAQATTKNAQQLFKSFAHATKIVS